MLAGGDVEPVASGLVKPGVGIVSHRACERFSAVEDTVVVEVRVDHDAREPRLARIPLAIAIAVVPLGTVDAGAERLVAKVDGDCDYRVGDSLRFTCNPSGVLFFDAQQGVRLE